MENTAQADVIEIAKPRIEELEKQLEIERQTIENMRLEINALNSANERKDRKIEKFEKLCADFAELFLETPQFTSIIDSVKEEITQDIDIDGNIKEIIRNDLSVSISDAYVSVDI